MRAVATILGAIVVLQVAQCAPGLQEVKQYFKNFINPHIINGEESARPIPYQAALVIKRGSSTALCGGVLINPQWVLTAGHCVKPAGFSGEATAEVILGAFDRTENEPTQQRIRSEKVIPHPDWKGSKIAVFDDLALIKLQQPAKKTASVDVVRLPSNDQLKETFDQRPVLLSGWGWNSDKAGFSVMKLRSVQTSIIDNKLCKKSYGWFIKEKFVCTSGADNKGVCKGDSGGPMVVFERDGKPTLVGIAAFTHSSSCEAGYPSVFTRVTEYMDWIRDTMASSK